MSESDVYPKYRVTKDPRHIIGYFVETRDSEVSYWWPVDYVLTLWGAKRLIKKMVHNDKMGKQEDVVVWGPYP